MNPNLYAEDESKTLCQNWQKLCQAVVARSCVDYEMLKHPIAGNNYLRKWYGHHGSADLTAWIESQKYQLEQAFDNGLGELAEAVNKKHLIEKVKNHRASDWNIRKLARAKKLRITKR